MRRSFRGSRWAIPALLPLLGACFLDWTEVRKPALVIANATVVLTVDPMDSTVLSTDVLAFLVRDSADDRVTEASVRIVDLSSGRALRLEELPDTRDPCRPEDAAPVGTCYAASVASAHFAPLAELSLQVALSDGRQLFGTSTMPGLITPARPSLKDGRCRADPETNYRIRWGPIRNAWAHIAEAHFKGLRHNLWESQDPLYLSNAWMAAPSYRAEMGFPRTLIEGDVPFNARKAARRLESGLPWGVTVDLAVAAIDRNWANWIRPGQVHVAGEVPVPSVFGDGTGMFGTAVRWTATIESRDVEDETGLVDCDMGGVSYGPDR